MNGEIRSIDEKTVVALYGPMRLSIQAWGPAGPSLTLAEAAGQFSFTLLPRLVPARKLFSGGPAAFAAMEPNHDEPMLNDMVRAVRKIGLPELGPMAAVAGVVADRVAGWLKEAGAVKGIVENGGDLAITLAPDQEVVVGARLGVGAARSRFSLKLSGAKRESWGVASRGVGGRGLTTGIADTALCVAESGALADAAATAVAAACRVDSPMIKTVPAETLFPDTDIAGLMVTTDVGYLSAEEVGRALGAARLYAESLVASGAVWGAMASLKGQVAVTSGFEEKVAPLVKIS